MAARLGATGIGLDGQGGIVLPGDRLLRERRNPLLHVLYVAGILDDLFVLSLARHNPGQREQGNGNRHQQADNHTEYVEEVGVLLAHDVIRVGGAINWRRSIAVWVGSRSMGA